tara:strand:+ start:11779 stop:12489 length:711 start_codon:yes stop_codon:yes gene_type:complete
MKNIHQYKTKKYINNVFDNVYENYDLMNDVMSFGAHRLWKQEFINSLDINPNHQIIDMASGTGDISNLILKKNKHQKIYRIEPNFNMLNYNIIKFNKFRDVNHICSYAENIPLQNKTVDAYIISFGLRNVSKIDQALTDAFRVLKKGGGFYCLEFYKVNKPILKNFYNLYSKTIPFFGKLFNQNSKPYEYLVKSIEDFYSQNEIKKELIKAGFKNVNFKNIFGGIASIHYAWKLND